MSWFWNATYEVARNEVLQHLRTKRLLIIGSLLLGSLILMTIVLPITLFELDQADANEIGGGVAIENFAFMLFLNFPLVGGYLFIQLLAIVLTADGVSSEWQRKTLFLLLSKPVPRAAFVLGKFFGAIIPIVVLFSGLFILDYLLLQAVYDGTPSGEQVARFFGAVGLLILGAVAFAAMGLLFSALTRSSVSSLIWALAAGLLIFPIVGAIGDFNCAGAGSACDPDALAYDWSHYVTPNHVMTKAGEVLLGVELDVQFSLVPTNPASSTPGVTIAGVLMIVVFLAATLIAVQKRNFE